MKIKNRILFPAAFCLLWLGMAQVQAENEPAPQKAEAQAVEKAQPKTADEAFLLALKEGDIDRLKAALAQGADIEKKSLWFLGGCTGASEVMTPQEAVCRFFYDQNGLSSPKRLELLQFLLENGSKPKPLCVWGAAVSGDAPLLEVFRAHRADLNAKHDPEGEGTPLNGAKASLAYVVKRIEEVGPEETSKSYQNMLSGLTVLSLTVQKENLEKVIQILEAAGAKDKAD